MQTAYDAGIFKHKFEIMNEFQIRVTRPHIRYCRKCRKI